VKLCSVSDPPGITWNRRLVPLEVIVTAPASARMVTVLLTTIWLVR